jgi:peptidyl-prolyl cis-trans isomerase-like 4
VDFSQSVAHIWKQFKRHGKAGGNAGTAAEADNHERGQQQQQQRGPPSGSRYIDLKGPGQRGRGMLFDQAELLQQQQQQQLERPKDRRGWDEPQRPSSAKRSRSRSRGRRERSRSGSRSRSRSRDHKHKKHKKQHKKEKQRDAEREPAAAAAAASDRHFRGGYDSRRGPEGRGYNTRDAPRQIDAGRHYSTSSREADGYVKEGRRDWRDEDRSGRGGERDSCEVGRSRGDGEHGGGRCEERRGGVGRNRERERGDRYDRSR